jgi:ATP-dependent protease ClpP protease subunit
MENNELYLIGIVGGEINLNGVISFFEQADKEKPVKIHISTDGGNVLVGKSIYKYLTTKRAEGWKIETYGLGVIASMGTIIFLAGNKETRYLHADDYFYLHLPSNTAIGTADELSKQADELKRLEQDMAGIYAQETNLTIDEALQLMKSDKSYTAKELKEMGFVSEVIETPVMRINNNKNKKGKIMGNLNQIINGLAALLGAAQMKIVQDVEGTELDFYEVKEDADVKVGDKALVNGKPAVGEFVVKKNEETFKFIFDENGTLKEIVKIEKVEPADDETTKELQKKVEELQEELNAKMQLIAEMKAQFNELAQLIKSKGLDAQGNFNSGAGAFVQTNGGNVRKPQILK